MSTKDFTIGVIGAGTMGQGIAQLALQAGYSVVLVDQSSEQLDKAKSSLDNLFTKFVAKQKISQQDKDTWLESLVLSSSNDKLVDAKLVIEAIVERLDIKQKVFSALESIVNDDTILATNTSSLSVTAIASCLERPERFIGLHFFNPPGIMPLVEVIEALQTDETVTESSIKLMQDWGKSPVKCKNTPGFIVNRVARPFYVESFRLIEDNITTPRQLDASIRSAGFRMGPCELTDFIGQDINYAVSCSLFDSLFYPTHLRPSYVQGSLVEAGFLGRKSGRGFYKYTDNKAIDEGGIEKTTAKATINFVSYGQHPWVAQQQLDGVTLESETSKLDSLIGILENGVHIYSSDGKLASDWEAALNVPIMLVDIKHPDKQSATVAIAAGYEAQKLMNGQLPTALNAIDWALVDDRPGLINLRVISMIINEAIICATQGIAAPEGIDSALKGGVNYPLGAFEWLDVIGADVVVNTLTTLRRIYGSGSYTVPPMLTLRLRKESEQGTKQGTSLAQEATND